MTLKIILIGVGTVAGLIGVVAAAGRALPMRHSATRSARFEASVPKVWAAIQEFRLSGDTIIYETVEAIPERRLIRKIADPGLPFGGSWTFELKDDGRATILAITENGEVYNPIFRFMSKFVFGHHATLEKYLKQLENHLRSSR